MSQKLWIEYETPAKKYIDKVSIEGCVDVDDFLKEIKKSPQLSIPSKNPITLYKSDGTTEIDVGESPSLLVEGNSRGNPLIVKSNAVGISSRLVNTRIMSVEAFSRNYLDVLAFKLSTYYVFKRRFKAGATFGDVLEAITTDEKDKKPRWSHILETASYEQVDKNWDTIQINAGDPVFPIPLPSLFTTDEWDKLRVLNKTTTTRIHMPLTLYGKACVVIPHSEFNEEMISFLKSVGVNVNLISSPDDLDVISDSSFVPQ